MVQVQEDKGRKLEVYRKYRKKSKDEDLDLQTVALVGGKRTQLRLIEPVQRCFAARDLDAFSLNHVMEE